LITDLKIRKYPCLIEPVKFLDDQSVKARHGVLFRLEFVTERGTFEAYVETRIKPTQSIRKDGDMDPPFVCCNAFNPETKKRDPITWDFVQNVDFYKRNIDTPIEEWYKGWLFKALIHKKNSKIFNFMKQK
jgi:hypothetical protein